MGLDTDFSIVLYYILTLKLWCADIYIFLLRTSHFIIKSIVLLLYFRFIKQFFIRLFTPRKLMVHWVISSTSLNHDEFIVYTTGVLLRPGLDCHMDCCRALFNDVFKCQNNKQYGYNNETHLLWVEFFYPPLWRASFRSSGCTLTEHRLSKIGVSVQRVQHRAKTGPQIWETRHTHNDLKNSSWYH